MKLSIYVHDLFYEIGHSNVTLNSLEYIDGIEDFDIRFIVFTADKKQNLFNKKIPVDIKYVPFKNIKPVFLKIIWFQLYSFLYSLIWDRNRTVVSLGVANINCDISIIHFIHGQWNKQYFKVLNPSGVLKWYKKIFFLYLDLCELILFKLFKPKVITVSNFMKNHLQNEFEYKDENIETIHSGFDLARYNDVDLDLDSLKEKHPVLKDMDMTLPLCLFVGAYERKGLKRLLELWNERNPIANLLIIGKSEGKNTIDISGQNIYSIEHTTEMNRIYQISDYLLFPTHYEPFGMVIIEALIKGLEVYTNNENVGASEILSEIEGVKTFDTIEYFKLPENFEKVSSESKKQRIDLRKKYFEQYNWKEISKSYKTILQKWDNKS